MISALSRPASRAAALFLVLTVVATYPIATAPASYTYGDHPDAQLTMWIMAWDAHALGHDPVNLFNANIFHPERRTLAYSETLLGYLPLFGPILWLGGNPVLAFNVVLLFSFTASGFAMYLFARHLTGREWPSIVAGVCYGFVPYRFVHVPQIQLEAMEWIPLAFLCLHRFLERGDRRYAAGLGVCVILEALCCLYYAIFLVVGLALYWIVLMPIDARALGWRKVSGLAVTACATAALLAPLIAAYWRVHNMRGLERSIEEITERSADAASYLASTAPLHLAFGSRFMTYQRDYLFPGVGALVLAGIGLVSARRTNVIPLAGLALFALAASFGPPGFLGVPVYNVLYAAIPIFGGLRQISRFGVLVFFAVSAMAAVGCAAIEGRMPARRRTMWMIGIATLVFMETFTAPLRYDRPGGVPLTRLAPPPEEYDWLAARQDHRAIVELPFAPKQQPWRNAPYVFWSTRHWHPLVNAYSGFAPPSYYRIERILRRFPDDSSRKALLARHVGYVIIHWQRFRSGDFGVDVGRVHASQWLQPVAHFTHTDIFEVH